MSRERIGAEKGAGAGDGAFLLTAKDQLAEKGIIVNGFIGNHRTTCPECSAGRKNKRDKCLSVTVGDGEAVWFCHHCGHSGGVGRGAGLLQDSGNKPSDFGAARRQIRYGAVR